MQRAVLCTKDRRLRAVVPADLRSIRPGKLVLRASPGEIFAIDELSAADSVFFLVVIFTKERERNFAAIRRYSKDTSLPGRALGLSLP